MQRVLLTAIVTALTGIGCQKFHDFFQSDKGVPLERFEAKNGRYFPKFIENFFRSTQVYYRDFPSLAEAQADLRLIEVRQLTEGKSNVNEANLSWSADGVYLGYEIIGDRDRKIMLKDLVGNYSREVVVVPKAKRNFLEGMVAQAIISYNAGLRWSQDSTRFAFMSNGGVGEYNIYVGAVGSKERIVTTSSTKNGYATWSPNTDEIAYVSSKSGQGDIYLLALGSNNSQQLSFGSNFDIFPEWKPGGNALIFASGDSSNHDLMLAARDPATKVWAKPRHMTASVADELRPTVSPDGRFVAFYGDVNGGHENEERRWNIYVIPMDKADRVYSDADLKLMAVAKDVVIDLNTGPAWTPDSRKIFYVARDEKNFNPIYGCDLFSGNRFLLQTETKMNRDILLSRLGVLSFRAQVGAWDRVFVALTNQGMQLQGGSPVPGKIHYLDP
jgi:Tol biopolymer transport system component